MEKDINVIECKKNEKGNYCISFSSIMKKRCVIIFIFLLLIFISCGFRILTDSYQDEKIDLFMLMIPVGFLTFIIYNFFFYKLELGDMLIVRERLSLKTLKIDYKELEKYKNDEDFLFGVLNSWAKLKIGDKKYISLPIEKEDSFIFLNELLKKVGIEDISNAKKNLIERDGERKNSILIAFVFIFLFVVNFLGRSNILPDDIGANILLLFGMLIVGFLIVLLKVLPINCENEFQKYFLEMRRREIRKVLIIAFIYVFIFFVLHNMC